MECRTYRYKNECYAYNNSKGAYCRQCSSSCADYAPNPILDIRDIQNKHQYDRHRDNKGGYCDPQKRW